MKKMGFAFESGAGPGPCGSMYGSRLSASSILSYLECLERASDDPQEQLTQVSTTDRSSSHIPHPSHKRLASDSEANRQISR